MKNLFNLLVAFVCVVCVSCGSGEDKVMTVDDIKVENLTDACTCADAALVLTKEMKSFFENKTLAEMGAMAEDSEMKKTLELGQQMETKCAEFEEAMKSCDSYAELEKIGEEMKASMGM